MTHTIDQRHFKDLGKMDPEDVCRRAQCGYDRDGGCYSLTVWGEEYKIYPAQSRIVRLWDGRDDMNILFALFIVQYLLTARDIPVIGEWVSEKDLPDGAAFFRGPHAIPTHLIAKRYGDSPGEFCERCELLHGTALDLADEAYSFRIAPRIPVAVLLWEGDDEFPAESKVLFDRTIGEHLALDVIFGLAVEICAKVADCAVGEKMESKGR
ncbi:MAG: DUF3786 domain-containing protein [Deltaproteobacteria bacterium]|nr:DUF3786 domain-containing protein [Deltaproteobacteria bacterium]MBW2047694.1 DUF3786 domain-containing protein [Deltaproteobacteria bacterium]MBW2111758.1 DUF3786 domain-containing protein [Deltaproteobacteria bacterium]MBW2353226.1 DUF3786 domain-containing protein [Deltaproteobacteria bacterium]HDZ91691.1 DUF3786 domain-containing protein [Deltaproteobacteria bacterium]